MAEAEASEPADPEAMAVATVDADGLPNVRMILLKGADARGFVFYTNCESAKGNELAANPKAALLFYWKSLGRQIRLRGPIEPATPAEADAYFATRHRESRIGACASRQSRPLASRAALEAEVERLTKDFGDGPVARPSYWRGYRLIPLEIEFWQNGRLPAARPHRVPPRSTRNALDQDPPLSVTGRFLRPSPTTNLPCQRCSPGVEPRR